VPIAGETLYGQFLVHIDAHTSDDVFVSVGLSISAKGEMAVFGFQTKRENA
jgi:hypothetical protein